jgi:propanediol dehydratase large subunit
VALYWCANGPMPTAAAQLAVTTGTAIKTMLQIATPATRQINATVTAHVAAGVQPYDNPDSPASLVTLGTAATGYTSSAEGTIVAIRYADIEAIPIGVGSYTWEWAMGRGFVVGESRFLRVRMTTATAVNAVCWVVWSE